jgi:hypothetical protein
MSGGTNSKLMTRVLAMLFMALAFAGCALILSSGERSLFADVGPPHITR